MIINENQTWKTGQVLYLNGDVQIDHGVTLTIEPGVVIYGNGYQIKTYGRLDVNGSVENRVVFNNVDLEFGDSSSTPGNIELSHVEMNGGAFWGRSGYGSFDVRDSVFDEVGGFYIWYPKEPSYFVGNIFNNCVGISAGTNGSGTLTIQNNVFAEQTTAYAIESWANYNNGISVVSNSFLSTDRVALAIREGYTSAGLDASKNYFGTTDLSVINAMILDQNDSLGRHSVVNVADYALIPDSLTPKVTLYWKNKEVILNGSEGVGAAVDLGDAISILKMIVGLDVNGPATPLSPYQAIAADFDMNGEVNLSDAIGVLKHVVGLTATAPKWTFFDDGRVPVDVDKAQQLDVAAWVPAPYLEGDPVGKIFGLINGDVNGSWVG